MNYEGTRGRGPNVLEHLVERLEREGSAFTPARRVVGRPASDLPDRNPGTNLASRPAVPTGATAVVLDCGISRLDTYTHVLWVSASAEAIIGSYGLERLADAIAALDCVDAYEWEGQDRLHLRAPGIDWNDMLREARVIVERLTP